MKGANVAETEGRTRDISHGPQIRRGEPRSGRAWHQFKAILSHPVLHIIHQLTVTHSGSELHTH